MLFLLLLCSGILVFQFVYLPLASEFHLEQASLKIIKNPQNELNNDTVQQQQQQPQPQLDEKNNSKSIEKPIPIVEINCQIAFISQVQKYVNHEYLQKKFSKHVRSLQNEKISLSFSKLSSFEELNSNTTDYFLFITTDSRTEASDAKGYLERNVIPRIQEHFDITKSSIIYTTSDSQLISKIPNLPLKNYYVQWTSDVDKVGKQGEEPLKEMTNDFVKSCRENRQRAIQESSHKKTTPFRKNKYSKTSRGGNSKSKRRNGGG
ncbi:hypothetical protein C9374_006041 [Naegleria lovaniensis]|uniref:Uncharacterized protein n=1 Tax=Naegleria lovaniensis TaxID=51637 RepID=A0AA88GNP4_NAELO|nr:uncharacterized protein C9374_006041 [Naegleria lovaniensis]KAG2381657.1 hypothetical protein C9374_006041 [Naegleria lovaniensis]